MALLTESGAIEERWPRTGDDDAPPEGQPALVSLARLAADWPALSRRNGPLGVEIANTVRAPALAPYLPRLELVSVLFPAFNDGRGFSLARQLRLSGFAGRLRATGPLIADQARHAFGVGFDEIDVPDALYRRQPPEQWRRMGQIVSGRYQSGYGKGESLLERRRAARLREAAE